MTASTRHTLSWMAMLAVAALPSTALAEEHKSIAAKGLELLELTVLHADVAVTASDEGEVVVRWQGLKLDFEEGQGRLAISQDPQLDPEQAKEYERVDSWVRISMPASLRTELKVVSGDVDVRGLKGGLELKAISGDVEVHDTEGDLEIESVSGDIRLSAVSGALEAKTVSGDVEVSGQGLARLEIHSHSGDIEVRGDIAPSARLELKTFSGDVEIRLPKELAVSLDAHTMSGDIDVGGGLVVQERSEHAVRASRGNGGARIELKTYSGDIEVR